MRIVSLSLVIAAGLATAAQAQVQAQTPATPAPTPSTANPSAAPPAAPGPAPSSAPASPSSSAPGAAPAAPTGPVTEGAPPPEPATPATTAPPAAAAEPAPTLPTSGEGAVLLTVLEKVCVPLVRGGNLDQLAGQIDGARKNRRDGSWSIRLEGSRDYNITIEPKGVNKDTCLADIHYAIGQDEPFVKALNVWSFLHKPELILQANYVNVDPDGVKRVRKSWEHLESNSSVAVNFTTWRKPDDTPLNRKYDTAQLYYQERHF